MAIVREYGKPTYFITMTASSDWEEIKSSLFPGENSHDRPDVVTRIFEQKVKELIRDLMKRGVLGKVKAILLMTEWQKRGENIENNNYSHPSSNVNFYNMIFYNVINSLI